MSIQQLLNNSAIRYLFAGGLAFVFNVALLNLFREGFGWDLSLSAALAFWGTFGFSYGIQRIMAFRSTSSITGSVIRYSILVAFNSVVVTAVVTVCNGYLSLGLGTAQLIATVLTTTWNYFAYKHWVYKNKQETNASGTAEQPSLDAAGMEESRP
ncbi:GtrA family protein [Tessaracoccus sp. OH4464_COT-324]|uniref:GtrA family protein n=1 Tax=Tessaracoccus sp. OH4464_COT-324 TaxID=2491059 RepID=UPI000F630756|nr:GtrA family protein [Tessaracoccus sp. OH4464_COT-324]RRD46166.1 GtrA family protein [Tessaracoccus sp. OH4464_COT-324]